MTNEQLQELSRRAAGFWLSTDSINELVVNSLHDLIRRAKQCSLCDIDLRENGKNVRFEADWVKYLQWTAAAPSEEQGAEAVELLHRAMERMDRARNVLTGGKPTPICNWGMLDTSDLRRALLARK